MASSINVQGICALKGDIPVGTGLLDSGFARTASLPLDSNGNAQPGYTLQSNPTTINGVSWNYTGANGSTVRTYSFPSNTPTVFPTPSDISSNLVLITREDRVVSESGLVDLAMPVLGVQNKVPTHTLPPLCDKAQNIVFFFDDANAAINVYQLATKSWLMGWMRAVPSDTFLWRAAALLTEDLVKLAPNQYLAPYDSRGIFISASTTSLTNQNGSRTTFANPSGFFFANYATTSGSINAFTSVIEPYPYGSDLSVSAIAPVKQSYTVGANAVYYLPTLPAPGVPVAKQIVAAVAVSTQSSLTGNLYGWWGFLGRRVADDVAAFFNPDLTDTATNNNTPLNFCFRSGTDPYTPTGFVETISYDGGDIFFLGGNYDYVRFDDVVVQITITGNTQRAAVAMQYRYSGTAEMISGNYAYVGGFDFTSATTQNWSGRVTRSNYTPDNYFAYGGTFLTPKSDVETVETSGPNVDVVPSEDQPIILQTSFQDQTITPQATVAVPTTSRGGVITDMRFAISTASGALGTTGSADDYGVCVNLVPDDGDVKQGSFPQRYIGGNFLTPSAYAEVPSIFLQTQEAITPGDWWMSSISFYVEEAATRGLSFVFGPISLDFNTQAPPYIFAYNSVTLKAGLNIIPFLGGGNSSTNTAGNIVNTHIKNAAPGTPDITIPNTYVCFLGFFEPNTTIPSPVKVGINPGNGNRFTGCWLLEGYPATGLTTGNAGFFSSAAINQGKLTVTNSGTIRTLDYTPVDIPVPLTTKTYNATLIPINVPSNTAPVVAKIALATGQLVAQFVYSEDRQGSFKFSCLHNPQLPRVIYEVPPLTTSTGVQPAFSLFANSRYEIYKTAWANSDTVALSLYTNFQEITDMPYVFAAPASPIGLPTNAGVCCFNVFPNPTQLRLNAYEPDQTTIFDFLSRVQERDIIKVTKISTGAYNLYSINGTPTQPAPFSVATFPISLFVGTTAFAATDRVLITIVLSRNPLQTPFVLKDNFGQFAIGNGEGTLRDVFLAPSQATGKSYRYIPNYESNFISFKSGVYLGSETTDDVFEVNTALFNSNSSSILLTKSSNPSDNKWVVTNITGNVGFNTQNA